MFIIVDYKNIFYKDQKIAKMKNPIQFAKSFISKFIKLSRDFLIDDPKQNISLTIVNTFSGLIYPLPYTALAYALSLVLTDGLSGRASFFNQKISVSVSQLIFCSIILGLTIYFLRFVISQKILLQVSQWQRRLMYRSINVLKEIPNYGYKRPFIPVELKVYHAYASRMAAAGSQIGLLFVFGVHNIALISFCVISILIIEWHVIGILILVCIPFVPFYSFVMRRIFQVRDNTSKIIKKAQISLKDRVKAIEEELFFEQNPIYDQVPTDGETIGITLVNRQYAALLELRLLVALHSGTMMVVFIYLIMSTEITPNFVIPLAALVFIMVSAISSFIQFLGNLTRNYTFISALSDQICSPKKSKIKNCYAQVKCSRQTIDLHLGDTIFINDLFPDSKLTYQKLSAVLWDGSKGEQKGRVPMIVPYSEFLILSTSPRMNIKEPKDKNLPMIISLTPEQYKSLNLLQRENFIWAIFSEASIEKVKDIAPTAVLIRRGLGYSLSSAPSN